MSRGYYSSLAGSRDSKMQGTEAISWHGKSCGVWHWKHENSEGETRFERLELKNIFQLERCGMWNILPIFSKCKIQLSNKFSQNACSFLSGIYLKMQHRQLWYCVCVCVCARARVHMHAVHTKSLSHVWLFATLWTVAHQTPLSMGILQAGILQLVAMPSSMGSFKPRSPALQADSSLSH